MFPSPPNFESLLKRSSSFPPNPTSNSINDPSLLFNFPSPFLDEHESPLNQIFSQNHHDQQTAVVTPAAEIPKPRLRRSLGVIPRRRAGKKDRHSKICTAQGIRDRRMRLSLQVARKFFDLQDMLGYDKASKTIEWLFNQSNKAITDLVHDFHHQSESFVSECEETSETNSSNALVVPTSSKSKYARDEARARARCRTREKMLVKLRDHCFKPNPNYEAGVVDGEGIRVSPCEQVSDVGTIEKLLGNSYSDPNSSSSSFMGFLGNWDVLSSDRPNCFHYSLTNHLSFAGNPNSLYSPTAEFP